MTRCRPRRGRPRSAATAHCPTLVPVARRTRRRTTRCPPRQPSPVRQATGAQARWSPHPLATDAWTTAAQRSGARPRPRPAPPPSRRRRRWPRCRRSRRHPCGSRREERAAPAAPTRREVARAPKAQRPARATHGATADGTSQVLPASSPPLRPRRRVPRLPLRGSRRRHPSRVQPLVSRMKPCADRRRGLAGGCGPASLHLRFKATIVRRRSRFVRRRSPHPQRSNVPPPINSYSTLLGSQWRCIAAVVVSMLARRGLPTNGQCLISKQDSKLGMYEQAV